MLDVRRRGEAPLTQAGRNAAERDGRRLRTKRRASAHASGACVKTVNANREARRPFKAMSTPYGNNPAEKQEAESEGVA